ncbi:hypothetical protein Hanom_Chr02g00130951 [Helianthus anomalus]
MDGQSLLLVLHETVYQLVFRLKDRIAYENTHKERAVSCFPLEFYFYLKQCNSQLFLQSLFQL